LSFRNLPHVQVISPGELNTYDVLCNDWLVFSKDVVPASDAQAAAPKADKPAAEADVSPHGEGSHAPIEGDEMPDGFPIKGNAGSMLYHLPDTSFYNRTVAEVWFATEEAAKAAGFTRPASQLKKEEES
jgi:large subunit ribosomal protein L4